MRTFIKRNLSNALLIWFAVAWLGLAFIPMLQSQNHTVSFVESNMVILGLEICLCISAIAWGILRIKRWWTSES